MAFTLFSTATVVAVAVAGLTVLRKSPSQICPNSFHTNDSQFKRYVFIGDIHGSSVGLREVLDGAGVIEHDDMNPLSCRRSQSPHSLETVVVQLGDLVDRGQNASIAWDCLDELQETSLPGSIYRLIGNHEVDWIQGNYRGSRDSPDYRRTLTKRIRDSILQNKTIGSLSLFNGQILITHAGLRQTMYNYIKNSECKINDNEDNNHDNNEENNHDESHEETNIDGMFLAQTIHNKLYDAVSKCPERHSLMTSNYYRPMCPELRNPIFGAGPERGGNGIGGPFWTDYSIISQISKEKDIDVSKLIQIVGHSAATCDVSQSSKCQPIRSSKHAIAVDAAIYWGNRAYLEILINDSGYGQFISHTKQNNQFWLARNLTHGNTCGKPFNKVKIENPLLTTKRLVKKYLQRF